MRKLIVTLFILLIALVSVAATFPIKDGLLQSNLNSNNKSITNGATYSATNGVFTNLTVMGITAKSVLVGQGTSQATGIAPGPSGNVLLSNGTDWTSGTLAGSYTLDTEWDTEAEVEAIWGKNIIVSTEVDSESEFEAIVGVNYVKQPDIDTLAELEAIQGGINIIAATEIDSSSELAAILGDETGSGVAVFGTSPTITTPTISGAISFPDNVRQTFNPGADNAGLNAGAHTADPSSPSDGDIWYNSTAGNIKARANGSTFVVGAGGAGAEVGANSDITSMDGLTGALEFPNRLTFITNSTPSTPAAGKVHLYAKSDGKIYRMATDGVETEVGATTSYDGLSALVNAEVSVTAAATLTSSAFGKMHKCTGTTADYTVGLPAVAGNTGKLIGIRMGTTSSLTKLVTIDANLSETIDGATTRVMWSNETAILLCDGTEWIKISGKSIPMRVNLTRTTDQAISTGVNTAVAFTSANYDDGSLYDSVNSRILIRRAGRYHIGFFARFKDMATGVDCIFATAKNAVAGTGPYNNINSKQTLATLTSLDGSVSTSMDCSAGDYINGVVYHNSVGTESIDGVGGGTRPIVWATEIIAW